MNRPEPTTASLDLLDYPLAFSQARLLTANEFERASSDRGMDLAHGRLEALHRVAVLVPRYAIDYGVRATRAIRRATGGPTEVHPALTHVPLAAPVLRRYRDEGRLLDASAMLFVPWSASTTFQGRRYSRYRYLYSPHQLLRIPELRQVRFRLRRDRYGMVAASVGPGSAARETMRVDRQVEDIAVALDMLATIYRPGIVGRINGLLPGDVDEWYQIYNGRDATLLLARLGWPPDQVRRRAEWLLGQARSVDPLRNWLELVRHVGPGMWDQLRGDALVAMDRRIAADILLRFYDDLVVRGAAEAIAPIPGPIWHPLLDRLGQKHQLDRVLTRYGLSPHPSVVLVVEGETEMALLPLIMEELGISRDESHLRVINAQTETRDHTLLATYTAVPRLGPVDGDVAEFIRPPTRYVIALDADRRFRTPVARETERKKWVSVLVAQLSPEFRTPTAAAEVDSLVLLETWAEGLDFERAHFTDRELAEALMATGYAPSGTTVGGLEADLRAQRRSSLGGHPRALEQIWHGWARKPAKPALALTLWPKLRARLRKKRSRAGLDRVPAARVLLLADDLARRTPRSNVVFRVRER